MGYDKSRFRGEIDDELECPICSSVFKDPVQASECEHTFCSDCIKRWLNQKNICPIDRQPLELNQLKCVPRIIRNMLAKLKISCDYAQYGCEKILSLDSLEEHCKECKYFPEFPVICPKGCGTIMKKGHVSNHECFQDLRVEFQEEKKKYEEKIEELREQASLLRSVLRKHLPGIAFKFINERIVSETEMKMAKKNMQTWCKSLPKARVLVWGSLISTPNNELREAVKKSLLSSGCPPLIVSRLVKNSHERRWPPGLRTLGVRKLNHSKFKSYLCRKIYGQQAIVIMSYENPLMTEDLIQEPGIILIFAHGIEEIPKNSTELSNHSEILDESPSTTTSTGSLLLDTVSPVIQEQEENPNENFQFDFGNNRDFTNNRDLTYLIDLLI